MQRGASGMGDPSDLRVPSPTITVLPGAALLSVALVLAERVAYWSANQRHKGIMPHLAIRGNRARAKNRPVTWSPCAFSARQPPGQHD